MKDALLAHSDAFCCPDVQEEATKGHRLQQQMAQMVEREQQIQEALQEARQRLQDRCNALPRFGQELVGCLVLHCDACNAGIAFHNFVSSACC